MLATLFFVGIVVLIVVLVLFVTNHRTNHNLKDVNWKEDNVFLVKILSFRARPKNKQNLQPIF